MGALDAGLDVASGLHTRLTELDAVRDAAARNGRNLFDVRHPRQHFPPGTGEPRSGLRVLTVGTDCSVGKMYTALALERSMKERGMKADFRATGQTGILIAGEGVSVDAVVSDFVSGAAEWLSPANDDDHWDVIEGQGSLFHPAYAGVTLGLVHGSQPDALVVCHQAKRRHVHGFPSFETPPASASAWSATSRRRGSPIPTRCASASRSTPRAWTRRPLPSTSTSSRTCSAFPASIRSRPASLTVVDRLEDL